MLPVWQISLEGVCGGHDAVLFATEDMAFRKSGYAFSPLPIDTDEQTACGDFDSIGGAGYTYRRNYN